MELFKADNAFLSHYDYADMYRTLKHTGELVTVPDEYAFVAKERRVPMLAAAYMAALHDGIVSLLRLRNGKMLASLGIDGSKPWKLVFVLTDESSELHPAAEVFNDIVIRSGPTVYPVYSLCDCAIYNNGTPVLFSGTREELVEYLGNSAFDAVLVPLTADALNRLNGLFQKDAYVSCVGDCTNTDAEVLDEE